MTAAWDGSDERDGFAERDATDEPGGAADTVPAMSGADPVVARGGGPAGRDPDLRLAHLHLRTGLLALARTELETAAGAATLDPPAMLDLAEIRWRTGDLAGGGVAAEAFLGTGGEAVLGRVIAAEAAALDGRQADAREHADATRIASAATLDGIFAGMPRVYGGWPTSELGAAHATVEPEPSVTLTASVSVDVAAGLASKVEPKVGPEPEVGASEVEPEVGVVESPGSAEAGSTRSAQEPPVAPPVFEPGLPSAGGTRTDRGLASLALALRLDPERAAEIVEAVRDEPGVEPAILRGDALRLLGREDEASQAYQDATRQLELERQDRDSHEGAIEGAELDPAPDAGGKEDT